MFQLPGILGKFLIGVGLFIVILGVILLLVPKIPFLGRMPGDIIVQRENFTFYFPVVTSVLLSVILTIILNLFFR
jgi:hypothetical protein